MAELKHTQSLAPVALFVYNRPSHTRRVLESLQANALAEKTQLFVFADGPKEHATEEERKKIRQVREIVNEKKWCGKVSLIISEKNKGLAASVIDGVSEVTDAFGKIIVLEDDLVCSPHFLGFMNQSLDVYENEDRVVCISAYIYPVKERLPETFFLRGADCWGWATWKRGWDMFDQDGKKLLNSIVQNRVEADFDFGNSYPYTQMLREQVEGKNNSWAIRWYASAFLENKLTLYPGRSLVQNTGVDGSGTHSGNSQKWNVQLAEEEIAVRPIDPVENAAAKGAVRSFFLDLRKQRFRDRLAARIRRFLGKK